jgi:hypothetical protein
MKNLYKITKPGNWFKLLLPILFLAGAFCSLNAQSPEYYEWDPIPGIPWSFEMEEDDLIGTAPLFSSHRDDYLVSLDTFRTFSLQGNDLLGQLMIVTHFNDLHQLASYEIWYYVSFMEEFVLLQTYFRTYDDYGRMVADTNYSHNLDGEINPNFYRIFEYDDDDINISTMRYNWNTSDEEWRLRSLFERTMENDLRVLETNSSWNQSTGEWVLTQYSTWEYENELQTHYKLYRLRDLVDTFYLSNFTYWEYNDEGLVSLFEVHQTPFGDSIIQPSHKNHYYYDDSELINFSMYYEAVLPVVDETE